MEVQYYENINEYIDLVFPFLLKNEAENNLLFSILNALKLNQTTYGDSKPILIVVKQYDEIKLVALRTPPYNQLISYTDDLKTLDVLVKDLLKKSVNLPGILGFKDGVQRFIKKYCENKGLVAKLTRNERGYKLLEVAKQTFGNKPLIVGEKSHQSLILKWAKEMILEAGLMTKAEQMDRTLNQTKKDITYGKIFLLLDNTIPVSMARIAGKTPNGGLINLVYSPPPFRRKGYATECVAKLSQRLLDEGNKFCFLFTDLANPTSNRIYQKIGYLPIIDMDQYIFLKK
ncbi:MAG: GNAT family N-acetyltransferase [Promethearchaeota archaeon]|nr:MAG: GNAT family N-acetyltransferase [Candidatus Lokiarchaeota archaeon]